MLYRLRYQISEGLQTCKHVIGLQFAIPLTDSDGNLSNGNADILRSVYPSFETDLMYRTQGVTSSSIEYE